ncbi:DgyrCDS8041 [Dimorphilus gyrociliatus]|uniref:DgyrCDS8041 n=1 Tax=Dimorphilus gyrociliatus TaxID=2664684 RepID=A0A7I8VU14_9ANNE|nr:DgyrCDS8041 [Dimorphilus gyrociliatus]
MSRVVADISRTHRMDSASSGQGHYLSSENPRVLNQFVASAPSTAMCLSLNFRWPLVLPHFRPPYLPPTPMPHLTSPFFPVFNAHSKKLYNCQLCRYVTDRKNNLKRHVSTMHQSCDKLLECCNVSFKNKAALRDHVLIFHSNGYMCRFCGRNFCRKALLKRHLAVHSGKKDFTCTQCDYATSHKSNLERHKKVHERHSHKEEIQEVKKEESSEAEEEEEEEDEIDEEDEEEDEEGEPECIIDVG